MSTLVSQSTGGGEVESVGNTYADAREGTGFLLQGLADTFVPEEGQKENAGTYDIFQALLQFDTSAIESGTIQSVTLQLTPSNITQNNVAHIVEVRLYDWGGTIESDGQDFVVGSALAALTLVASLSTSGLVADTPVSFTVEAAMLQAINRSGMTRFIVVNANQRTNTAPGVGSANSEHVGWHGSAGATPPKLTIEYTIPPKGRPFSLAYPF